MLVCILAPVVAPYDPNAQDLTQVPRQASSAAHWLGCDQTGRDIFLPPFTADGRRCCQRQ
ncbi:MAG: hypothetical protein ACLUNZ_09300 [Evtepia sp.]